MIVDELRMLVTGRSNGQIRCVLSSDIPCKRDGAPYADFDEPSDPGAAVWWVDGSGDLCAIACDAWNRVSANFRAIALNIHHMRAVQRTKATQILAKMTQSFKVPLLASVNPESECPPCARVLGFDRWPVTQSELSRRLRELVKTSPNADEESLKNVTNAYHQCLQLVG